MYIFLVLLLQYGVERYGYDLTVYVRALSSSTNYFLFKVFYNLSIIIIGIIIFSLKGHGHYFGQIAFVCFFLFTML